MKKLFSSSTGCKSRIVAAPKVSDHSTWNSGRFLYIAVLMGTLLFAGCKKQDTSGPASEIQSMSNSANDLFKTTTGQELFHLTNYPGLETQTLWELQQARAATERYRNIDNAIRDGYLDIPVDVENMGHHFMKSSLVDSTIDIRKPELLVYNRDEAGIQQLVAVEYALPIDLSPNVAPEGFTGASDVWDRNTDFQLWLLHAWVWSFNPSGVFNPTNPLVHLH